MELQDAIIRGYDRMGRPIADLASAPRDTTVHPLRDPDGDPRTEDDWEAMVTRPELSHVRRGGRSESGGRAKPLKFIAGPVGGLGGSGAPGIRFQVYGLTRGEAEFFHNRRGEALQVLVDYIASIVARIEAGELLPSRAQIRRTRKQLVNFDVYGLSEKDVKILRADPGAARVELSTYARSHDGARIKARDDSRAR